MVKALLKREVPAFCIRKRTMRTIVPALSMCKNINLQFICLAEGESQIKNKLHRENKKVRYAPAKLKKSCGTRVTNYEYASPRN